VAKRTDSKVDRKRKLEELKRAQRAKERRKTLITVVAASVVGLVLVGSVVGASIKESRDKKAAAKKATAEREANIAKAKTELTTLGVPAASAECSPVRSDEKISEANQHVQVGQEVDYKAGPPTGGQHAGQTLPMDDQNFYDMDAEKSLTEMAVHNLEHGVVVAWYDKKLPAAEVEALKKIAANTKTQERRFLVMPWQRGDLPEKPLYLSAWGHKQGCGKASGEAVLQFLDKFENGKDAPERGARV
jgi:hypothetical protein